MVKKYPEFDFLPSWFIFVDNYCIDTYSVGSLPANPYFGSPGEGGKNGPGTFPVPLGLNVQLFTTYSCRKN
jgi:hypothetical protein